MPGAQHLQSRAMLLLNVVVLCLALGAGAAVGPAAEDRLQMTTTFETWLDSFNKKDFKRHMALMTGLCDGGCCFTHCSSRAGPGWSGAPPPPPGSKHGMTRWSVRPVTSRRGCGV